MLKEVTMVRLDKLNVPAEKIRKTYSPGMYNKLKASIKKYGILVPLVVRSLGKEYAVIDGAIRVRILREIGSPGETLIPALILEGGDKEAIIAEMNINQIRERVSSFGEFEAFRSLVKAHKMDIKEASSELGKTNQWGVSISSIFELPKDILQDLRNGLISVGHAKVIAKYVSQPSIMKTLHKEAKTRNISSEDLAVLGRKMMKQSISKALKTKPKVYKLTNYSWVRIEPTIDGKRFEVHYSDKDEQQTVIDKLTSVIKKV